MKNETSEHIRQRFFKWADENGIDKASHEEWNKFLSIWNECLNYVEPSRICDHVWKLFPVAGEGRICIKCYFREVDYDD